MGCFAIFLLLFVVVGVFAAQGGGGGDETAGGGGGGGQQAQESDQGQQNQDQAQNQDQGQQNQDEGQAQGQGQGGGQQGQGQEQGGGQPADSGGGEGVIFRVTGTPGVQFQGSIATLDRQRSVEGVTPQDYPLKDVYTGMFSTDVVSGNAQNMTGGNEKLTVQIVVDGEVVKQASTTASYGVTQVSWTPSE